MSKKPAPRTGGKDLEAFRSAHDKAFIIPRRIREALVALGESWEYEAEFIKRCGVSQTDFATYRDLFDDFYVDIPRGSGNRAKRVWAGSKAFATKLRGSIT